METVVVTLRLPTDLYSLVKKYAKAFIINEQFSNGKAIENKVLNSKPLENKTLNNPSLDDVAAYAREINSSVNPQRFFAYYEKRDWVDKNGLNFDWKQKLREWGTYNLEKTSSSTSRNTPIKGDFKNDDSFKNEVAALLKEGVA